MRPTDKMKDDQQTASIRAAGKQDLRRLREKRLRLCPADIAYREAVDRGDVQPAESWIEGCEIGERLLLPNAPHQATASTQP